MNQLSSSTGSGKIISFFFGFLLSAKPGKVSKVSYWLAHVNIGKVRVEPTWDQTRFQAKFRIESNLDLIT